MSTRTFCLLMRGNPLNEILLGMKKTGFGAGKYAGFGGKVESEETVEAATIRELKEEAGINTSIEDLCPMARLTFEFPFKPSWSQIVHVFIATAWTGNPAESDDALLVARRGQRKK